MRNICLVLAGLLLSAGCLLASEGVADVIRLQKTGVSDDVLLAFVQHSQIAYDPTADEINEMRDSGISGDVIKAMVDRGSELRESASNLPHQPADAPEPTAEKPAPDTLTTEYAAEGGVEASEFYAPPNEDLNISYFYGSLAPYGHWRHIGDYGYCWQPEVVATIADWRPYCHGGHWEWTDSGWYWVSDYPWGWATFHYGRWFQDPSYGWLWAPDTTWGPAWVTWRQSSSYYGWAPLPPEARFEAGVGFSFHNRHVGFEFDFGLGERAFEFVPAGAFLSVDLVSARVPRSHFRSVYNGTTIVNNTYVYNDNRIINRGIPVNTVSSATGRRIQAVQVTDLSVSSGQTFRRGEVREGNRIAAFRPAIRSEAPRDPSVAAQHFRAEVRTRAAAGGVATQGSAGTTATARSSTATQPTGTAPTSSEGSARQRREAARGNASKNRTSVGTSTNTKAATQPSAQQPTLQGSANSQTKAQIKAQRKSEEARRKQEAKQQEDAVKARRDSARNEQLSNRAARQKAEESKRSEEAAQRAAATRQQEKEAASRASQAQRDVSTRQQKALKPSQPKAPAQSGGSSKAKSKSKGKEKDRDKDRSQ